MPTKLKLLSVFILGVFIINSNQSLVIALNLNLNESDLLADANLDFYRE